MTITRILPSLLATMVCAASAVARAGDPPTTPQTSVPATPARSAETTKERHEAERQRLIAKLRDEAPKAHDKPAKGTVLDLPIFHRNDRP
ncbi:MAG TPA: hypothetical protein VH041_11920 [Caldimonas sp.]|jgi:hypothetical protein|nr:hypothetical protein [Caldimonas sp.]